MIISSQLEKVGRAEALRAGHRERGQLEWKTNKKACLGWKGCDCRRGTWRRLPAVLNTFEHDSGDIQALLSRSIIHRYVLNIHCCGCHCSCCCWRRAAIEVAFFGENVFRMTEPLQPKSSESQSRVATCFVVYFSHGIFHPVRPLFFSKNIFWVRYRVLQVRGLRNINGMSLPGHASLLLSSHWTVHSTQGHQQYPQCPFWFFILKRYKFAGHRQWDRKINSRYKIQVGNSNASEPGTTAQ